MKKLLLFLFALLTLNSCDDKNNNSPKPVAEIDKLPPATQTGRNTVGCLLDGKVFKPGYYNNSTNCFYQFVDGDIILLSVLTIEILKPILLLYLLEQGKNKFLKEKHTIY